MGALDVRKTVFGKFSFRDNGTGNSKQIESKVLHSSSPLLVLQNDLCEFIPVTQNLLERGRSSPPFGTRNLPMKMWMEKKGFGSRVWCAHEIPMQQYLAKHCTRRLQLIPKTDASEGNIFLELYLRFSVCYCKIIPHQASLQLDWPIQSENSKTSIVPILSNKLFKATACRGVGVLVHFSFFFVATRRMIQYLWCQKPTLQ